MHEVTVGQHVVWFEPPNLIHAALRGDVSAEDILAFAAYGRARAEGLAYLMVLLDISRLGSVSPEACKQAHLAVGTPWRGGAMYGASYPARMAATMMVAAVQLVMRGRDHPMAFFKTESEARRWLDARREALGPAAPGG